MTNLTGPEWEDEWWAEVERARRAAEVIERARDLVGLSDGDSAARVAWSRMLARYGTPPPYAAAIVPARPYPRELATGGLLKSGTLVLLGDGADPPESYTVDAIAPRRGWLAQALGRVFR
jgi:hypothetical protein